MTILKSERAQEFYWIYERWLEEWKKWWDYVSEKGLGKHKKERIVLLFMLIKGIVANQIGIWKK